MCTAVTGPCPNVSTPSTDSTASPSSRVAQGKRSTFPSRSSMRSSDSTSSVITRGNGGILSRQPNYLLGYCTRASLELGEEYGHNKVASPVRCVTSTERSLSHGFILFHMQPPIDSSQQVTIRDLDTALSRTPMTLKRPTSCHRIALTHSFAL